MRWNLRHLRIFQSVARHASVSRAAEEGSLSQPAASQAIARLEAMLDHPLFHHRPKGLFPTSAGQMLAPRVARALARLDEAARTLSPVLGRNCTSAQLEALIAVHEQGNFTLAARQLGLSQPTVHRAVAQLELGAGRPLFERAATGLRPTRACSLLSDAARLSFAELEQARMDLAELAGREEGRIVVGAMPLSRSFMLSSALLAFRRTRPRIAVRIDEGRYEDLLISLRRGETDFLIGALRQPLPIGDIVQKPLFSDDLLVVVGPHHPLLEKGPLRLEDMQGHPWIVSRSGTPARRLFDQLIAPRTKPSSLVETGSLILMRQLLQIETPPGGELNASFNSPDLWETSLINTEDRPKEPRDSLHHIGFVSRLQALPEMRLGLMKPLQCDLPDTRRDIGLTLRADWVATRAQSALIDAITVAVAGSASK